MFKWLRKRREIKRMKDIRKELHSAIHTLRIVRDETIIGEQTMSEPLTSNNEINNAISIIEVVISEIDNEVDDRTRRRENMFRKIPKGKK